MARGFILASISPPEALVAKAGRCALDIWTKMKPLPALCRPAGWIALWRTIGNLSVLNCKAPFIA